MHRHMKVVFALGIAGLVSVLSVTSVFADKVYHSERLDLTLTPAGASTGHPALRHGQVVNIHPNGPIVAAIEKYMVSGAKAQTAYALWLHLQADGCDGAPLFSIETATIETDRAGNGHADVTFTPDDLAGLSGATVGASWTLRSGGTDAYATVCTTVVLD